MSGCAARPSRQTNGDAGPALTQNSAMTSGAANPAVSASMIAKTRAARTPAPSSAGGVDPVRLGIGALRQDHRPQPQRGQPEGEVEPEDRPPVPQADERAADDRPQGERQAGHGRPDADGPVPAALVGVQVPQHRQGARLARGGAQSHDGPPGDQHAGIRRHGTQHRSGAEDAGPGQHDELAAELVADHPARQHHARERQRVGADHPLQGGHPRVQGGLHAAQRDAHDRVVEERQEQHDHEDRQREWLPAVRHRRRHTGPGRPQRRSSHGMASLTCELHPAASAAGPLQPRGASPARPGLFARLPGRWRPGRLDRDLGLAEAAGTPYRPGPADDHDRGERGARAGVPAYPVRQEDQR